MGEQGLSVVVQQTTPIPLDARFECGPGEVLALVGPSGSGKSTILRCIAGLHRPVSGRIACAGKTWYDTANRVHIPPHERAVGLVFQSYALFPHMTALANVAAALARLSAGERDKRARALLDLVHLSGLEQRRPAELSGGQQQRVAVARALARDPKVLLLDEPFSAVDKVTRQKLYRELAELRSDLRMPVVLVTHDLDEAALLADRMTLLSRGRTLQTGTPYEVMTRPASIDAAHLVDLRNIFIDGTRVLEQHSHTNETTIEWNGRSLQARHQPQFKVGQAVAWVIPASQVILHRRDRPSRGEHENPVSGVVGTYVRLGDNASIVVNVTGTPPRQITCGVPAHVAERNRIAPGAAVTVSLRAEGIHLIPLDG